ncbi:Yip1 family protein [Bacillus massilinigeriensis]|uniref:Yip1 family protein n=1 Tax=Bacillus mediterraneensis TaxID=1805474 RepID=UPI0008F87155|nr:Yip1 family protein [Bacillus mediterraneensis]
METQTETNMISAKPSLLGMFTSPGVQFDRIKANPRIWIPLLLITVIAAISTFAAASQIDADYMIKSGVDSSMADAMVGFTKITAIFTGVLYPIIGVLISSAIYLAIAKIAGSEVKFKQMMSMNVYILVIGIAGQLLNGLLGLVIDSVPEVPVTSVGGFVNETKPGVLSAIEVFSIWSLVLTAIGLQRVANLSKGLSWTVVVVIFLITVGLASLSGMFAL